MPEAAQEWIVPVPAGIRYPSMDLDLDGEKLMRLLATKAELLQLAENILNTAENQ